MILAISAGRGASLELRARLALDREGTRKVLRTPRPGIGELLVLSTCHRTELYVTADGSDSDAVHAAVALMPALQPADHGELTVLSGSDAIRHLYRVACGLDSLVLGEPQILAQVRDAFTLAREEGAAGPLLSNVLARTLALGTDVRRSTPLGALASTIGAIAAMALSERFGGLAGRRGTVVGSGAAAEDAARALKRHGADLVVVGRSAERAERLARAVDSLARPLDAMPFVLRDASFAVVAVTNGELIGPASVLPRDGDPLLLIDISMPPAVNLPDLDDVEVRGIEDLTAPTGPDLAAAVDAAERSVEEAVYGWERWLDARPVGRDIGRFRARVEHLVQLDVAQTLAQLQLPPEEAERVAELARRTTNRMLHVLSVAMRDADPETRARMLQIADDAL